MAFPKTKSASDPMTGAPSRVGDEQLEELHIEVEDVEEDDDEDDDDDRS
jgi:aspartyl-tRNA synthetase